MNTKFIVEEYTGRKNLLLFTYPQKRSQILLAKFTLTFVFTFAALMLSNVAALLLIGLIGNMTGLVREDTELKNSPLFCPKCKQETIINVEQMNITVIKETVAQTQSR